VARSRLFTGQAIKEDAMRMPRVRFTLRRMMIAVAIVAVGMGTIAGLARRRDSYLNQAARHRRLSNNALL
jgi:hypothetical protein